MQKMINKKQKKSCDIIAEWILIDKRLPPIRHDRFFAVGSFLNEIGYKKYIFNSKQTTNIFYGIANCVYANMFSLAISIL